MEKESTLDTAELLILNNYRQTNYLIVDTFAFPLTTEIILELSTVPIQQFEVLHLAHLFILVTFKFWMTQGGGDVILCRLWHHESFIRVVITFSVCQPMHCHLAYTVVVNECSGYDKYMEQLMTVELQHSKNSVHAQSTKTYNNTNVPKCHTFQETTFLGFWRHKPEPQECIVLPWELTTQEKLLRWHGSNPLLMRSGQLESLHSIRTPRTSLPNRFNKYQITM